MCHGRDTAGGCQILGSIREWWGARAGVLSPAYCGRRFEIFSMRSIWSIQMHQTFDHRVPLEEQLMRTGIKTHTGRKHQHRIGAGKPRKRPNPNVLPRIQKLKRKVAAYWRGETDEYPTL
jgi:hypothetical protein